MQTRSPSWKPYLVLWIVMMALRQDFWFSRDATLLFGLIPVELAYQAGYSVLAALVMWVLVRRQWPAELEELERPSPPRDAESRR